MLTLSRANEINVNRKDKRTSGEGFYVFRMPRSDKGLTVEEKIARLQEKLANPAPKGKPGRPKGQPKTAGVKGPVGRPRLYGTEDRLRFKELIEKHGMSGAYRLLIKEGLTLSMTVLQSVVKEYGLGKAA